MKPLNLCLVAISPILTCLLLSGCPSPSTAPINGPVASANGAVPENAQAPMAVASLGNGQSMSLSLRREGSKMAGEVTVRSADASVQQLSRTISLGTYGLTGTFTAPRGFAMSGTFPAPVGAFSVSGVFPTLTDGGTATMTVNGETVTVPIPSIGSIPSASPVASPISSSPAPMPTAEASGKPGDDGIWTVEELDVVATCFKASFDAKNPASITPSASVRASLNTYISTKHLVTPAKHQEALNLLGERAVRFNTEYGFSCIN